MNLMSNERTTPDGIKCTLSMRRGRGVVGKPAHTSDNRICPATGHQGGID